jgi:hypothetical protein
MVLIKNISPQIIDRDLFVNIFPWLIAQLPEYTKRFIVIESADARKATRPLDLAHLACELAY